MQTTLPVPPDIDADEEGVQQEAQTSRLPSTVLGPAFSDGQRQLTGEQQKDRYQKQLEKQVAQDRRLVQMPKSRVKTAYLGEREQQLS